MEIVGNHGIVAYMPSKNVVRYYEPGSYYHVYNRGHNKQLIFVDDQDYGYFLSLLKRFIGESPEKDKKGRLYKWYGARVELFAFCLMPNHFHLLWYQKDKTAISEVMKSLTLAYVSYFNYKYNRVGTLFQQRFRAANIDSDQYLQHISRYIHLNPDDYMGWEMSSLPYYLGRKSASWINPEKILNLFQSIREYEDFISSYKNYRDTLKHTEDFIR